MVVIFISWLPLLLELDLEEKIHVWNLQITVVIFILKLMPVLLELLEAWDKILTKPRNFFYQKFWPSSRLCPGGLIFLCCGQTGQKWGVWGFTFDSHDFLSTGFVVNSLVVPLKMSLLSLSFIFCFWLLSSLCSSGPLGASSSSPSLSLSSIVYFKLKQQLLRGAKQFEA